MVRALITSFGVFKDDTDRTGVLRFSKQLDPSRVVYNAMVPFLVAAIEHFLRENFEILLKYDAAARKILEEHESVALACRVRAAIRRWRNCY